MKISSLENKKIAILGLGVTGREVYQVLKDEYQVTIINDEPVVGYQVIDSKTAARLEFDIVIKSPGVPYSHPFLKQTSATVTNDIELSYEAIINNRLSTQIVAITGTNGKTTTTQFIANSLTNYGYKAFSCGNIGQSPLLVLNSEKDIDYLVMELSSYQLKQVDKFTPNYGLFLNISPDHIDYHGSFDDYLNSKCKLFANMKDGENLVADQQMINDHPEVLWPNLVSTGSDESSLEAVTTITMPKQNYKLIFELLLKMGLDAEFITRQLNSFEGLAHRLELVPSKFEFKVINDSKATNVNATNVAIANLNRRATLIVGGSIKVEDYTLLDYKNVNVARVIAYGGAKQKFSFIPNVEMFDSFEAAVKRGIEVTNKDEILLLSPACASFDQHVSYVARGEEFKSIIKGTDE